jgi:hypothetical protein
VSGISASTAYVYIIGHSVQLCLIFEVLR